MLALYTLGLYCGCGADALGVKLVGSNNHNRLNVFARDDVVQAPEGVFDFEFGGYLTGALGGDIGHSYKARVGHQATQVFRVALAGG